MLDTIRDLFGHEAWADAEHLRVIHANPVASGDTQLLDRLNHIHLTQRYYLSAFLGTPAEKLDALGSLAELAASTRQYHDAMTRLLADLDPAGLHERIQLHGEYHGKRIELLLQLVMHSQSHRGQNARRLRELGLEAPLTDYIVWVWRGRAAPQWT